MKFSILASGSSGNVCIVEEHTTKIMIDCGTSKQYFTSALEELHESISSMDALLLTHGHQDHVSRIKAMREIESYGTFEIAKSGHHIIGTHDTFIVKDLKITSIPLSHDYAKTVGYIIESANEKLVYVTDTGYLNDRWKQELANAQYYIFESNHDPKMLMNSSRPYLTKQRILSAEGHLSNEDSALALASLVGPQTMQLFLAHLSTEANDETLALDTLYGLLESTRISTADKRIQAARQFEILHGGKR